MRGLLVDPRAHLFALVGVVALACTHASPALLAASEAADPEDWSPALSHCGPDDELCNVCRQIREERIGGIAIASTSASMLRR